jgi:antibiotic biosynthesis monooxygenase (ABM) superfamily enzyme
LFTKQFAERLIMTFPMDIDQNATVVISHRVKEGCQDSYEKWLNEIVPVSKTYPGHLGVMVVRPVPSATTTFTVIIRFDTRDHLLAWMGSEDRKRLIERVKPCLADDDKFFVRSGLDFWFTPEGAKAKLPTRWKQFLVTWSAIYPLVLLAFPAVESVLHQLAIPDNRYFRTLIVTSVVVLLMVYVVMPRYTKLVHRWLFN